VTVAVTGATGELGGRVARRLADRGQRQRLVVRDAARAPALEGAEVREASGYHSADEMRAALEGAHTLLLVPAQEAPNRVELHTTAVDAARDAGLERIVYFSFVGARPDCTFTFGRDHWHTEELIRSTGLPFTFLRMSLYMDFIPSFAGEDGVIRGPAGEGRLGAVLRDDLADAAVAVLASEGHEGVTYDITGPRSFSLAEIAQELSRAPGREITYEKETVEQAWESRAGLGPDWALEGWISSYLAIARGELDVVSGDVERLTGHPATDLADWLRA
jgi:NAD(P)H dehydrogenase (quinone)